MTTFISARAPEGSSPTLPLPTLTTSSPAASRALERVLSKTIAALASEGLIRAEVVPIESGWLRWQWQVNGTAGKIMGFSVDVRQGSFGRMYVRPGSLMRCAGSVIVPVQDLSEFVRHLESALIVPAERFSSFAAELYHTWRNDAQALELAAPENLDLSCAQLEARLQDAHPYHPCYKSRIGFSVTDNALFGPEFAQPLRVLWCAVDRSLCVHSRTDDVDEDDLLTAELGAGILSLWRAQLAARQLEPKGFVWIPVHPWQWQHVISSVFIEEIAAQQIVLLGESDDAYLPQQSIRSLSNHDASTRAALKLSLGIVNTSADRILSPHHVINAGPVSDWLDGIRRADPLLNEHLVLLREILGYAVDTPERWYALRHGQLSAIWRESVDAKLQPGEAAVPFSALYARDSGGQALLTPWLDRHGMLAWLRTLFECAVLPMFHLLYSQGIALEAHGQNLLLLHRAGLPSRIAVRDLPGGLRFCRANLSDPDRCPAMTGAAAHRQAGSIELDDANAVRDFLLDAIGTVNLAELAWMLQQDFDLPEPQFWRELAQALRTYQQQHPALAERFQRYDVFASTIRCEPLAKYRLYGKGDGSWQVRPNPLAGL